MSEEQVAREEMAPGSDVRRPRGPLAAGEQVLLLDRRGRRILTALQHGRQLHTHRGVVYLDALIGRPEGSLVRTSTGSSLLALRPRLMDFAVEMPRTTGVIYPKDAAIILVWADIFPGARVVEAGLGSGALTLALVQALGPQGSLVCYERRGDFINVALANLERFFGFRPSLLVRERDIYEGILERDLDRVLLDLPEPWRAVPAVAAALRPGGIVCAYNPSIIQVQRTVEALRHHGGFAAIEVLEVLHRYWQVHEEAVRPEQQMVGHTGFLAFARKLASEEPAASGEVAEHAQPEAVPEQNEWESGDAAGQAS